MNGLIFIAFYAVAISINATLLPKEIKETHDILKKEYQELSPLPGLVWVTGGVLENLAELSIEEKTTIGLIKKWFNRDNPLTFRETRADNNIASYLDERKLGQLAGYLKQFKMFLAENPKIRETISKMTNPQSLRKNEHIKKTMDELSKVTEAGLDETTKKKVERTAQSYPLLLVRALLDSDEDILVFKALASMVYLKAENKEKLHEYYQGLSSVLGPAIFIDNGLFLKENKEQWLKAHFDEGEVVDSYEGKVFSLSSGFWLGPYLTTYDTAYPTSSEAKGFGFPDCGEDSLLNIYRALFGKKDGSIDIELMVQLKTPDDVIAFFKTYKTLDALRTKAARNDWAGLLSHRKNLIIKSIYINRNEYQSKLRPTAYHCEINVGFKRMNQIIEDIQGLDFDALINALNKHRGQEFAIKIIKKLDADNNFGEIIVETADRGAFEWLFQEGHFIFRVLEKSSAKATNMFLNSPQPERDLTALIPMSGNKLKSLLEDKRPAYAIMLNKLRNVDDLIYYAFFAFIRGDFFNQSELLERIQSEDAQIRLRNAVVGEGAEAVSRYLAALEQSHKMSILAVKDTLGRTVFHIIAEHKALDAEVIRLLLSKIKPTTIINDRDNDGSTALHLALARCMSSSEFVRLLVSHMSTEAIEAQAKRGVTALHLAAIGFFPKEAIGFFPKDMITLLLSRMSTEAINARSDFAYGTALELSLGTGNFEAFKLILNAPQIKRAFDQAKIKNAIQSGKDYKQLIQGSNYLQNFDFSGLDLRGFDFSHKDLSGANFSDAKFDDTDFTGAILRGAIFKKVDLRKTNINFRQLKGSTMCEGVLVPDDFPLRAREGECTLL